MQWFGHLNPILQSRVADSVPRDSAPALPSLVPSWVAGCLDIDVLQVSETKDVDCESIISYIKSSTRKSLVLVGPVVLQIVFVRDAAMPQFKPAGASEDQLDSGAGRTLTMELTDGIRNCNAFESVRLESIQTSALYPGVKLLLHDCPIVAGKLALRPSNCELLGGHVDRLFSAWKAKSGLSGPAEVEARREAALRGKTGGPPPFVGFRGTGTGAGTGLAAPSHAADSAAASAGTTAPNRRSKEEEGPAPIQRTVPRAGVALPAFQRSSPSHSSHSSSAYEKSAAAASGSAGSARAASSGASAARSAARVYPCRLAASFAEARRAADASKRAAAAAGGRSVPSARRIVRCTVIAVELVAAPRPDLDPEPCLCVTATDDAGRQEALAASATLRGQLLGLGSFAAGSGASPGLGSAVRSGAAAAGAGKVVAGHVYSGSSPTLSPLPRLSDVLRQPAGERAIAGRIAALQKRFTQKGGLCMGAEVDFRVSPFALLIGMHAPPG